MAWPTHENGVALAGRVSCPIRSSPRHAYSGHGAGKRESRRTRNGASSRCARAGSSRRQGRHRLRADVLWKKAHAPARVSSPNHRVLARIFMNRTARRTGAPGVPGPPAKWTLESRPQLEELVRRWVTEPGGRDTLGHPSARSAVFVMMRLEPHDLLKFSRVFTQPSPPPSLH